MARRVVAVWGSWDDEDFVLEPTCPEGHNCEDCKDAFWIEKVNPNKKEQKLINKKWE